ncbi:DUF6919 domain-containing protein [Streptomyces phaeochromogenes]|uniref:DUF6919 domain-containing protein n=1 Tax=Streptomyces phaeochromogenes TaxID=1923 RepID=UPI003F4D07E6
MAHMLWHPNGYGAHGGGPDPETLPLVEILAAANLAGILTKASQPGELAEFHGRPWRQRAVFAGFVADPQLAGHWPRRPPRPGCPYGRTRRDAVSARTVNATPST